jgi:hypothetical protein
MGSGMDEEMGGGAVAAAPSSGGGRTPARSKAELDDDIPF